MSQIRPMPEHPEQRLPREAYIDPDWLERERAHLFAESWAFAGVVGDYRKPGDYRTVRVGHYSLLVMCDRNGDLRAWHNLCRHRGTELLEGAGNAGSSVVCPYHYWSYDLEGRLKGVPRQAQCFPGLDKDKVRLRPAALAIFKGLVFVHPRPEPAEPFETWLAGLEDVAWPHDLTSSDLREFESEVVYEMKCNWKVFFENAIDGYHLAYLHKNTLGGPLPEKNVWDAHGRHLVWYSTERKGVKHRIPEYLEGEIGKYRPKTIKGAEKPGYGGVYMLFPTTIVTPSPYSFTVSVLEPVDADTTLLRARSWSPKGFRAYREKLSDIPGYDKASGRVHSWNWTQHPLETGDFQTEDVWICEKMQRALHSPAYSVGGLARGAGGEAPLDFFQSLVREAVDPAGRE